MAALETAAAKVFLIWLKRGRLRIGEHETIGRWLATRLIIWTARDGGGRNLAEDLDVGGAAIPHFDRAKRLGAGARDALEGLAIGAARANGGATYGFGNASTEPNGKAKALTAVLALNFPPIQLWVVDALLPSEIHLPRGVVTLKDGLGLRALRDRGNSLSPGEALVRFPPEIERLGLEPPVLLA